MMEGWVGGQAETAVVVVVGRVVRVRVVKITLARVDLEHHHP
jgi:hypothetical protein